MYLFVLNACLQLLSHTSYNSLAYKCKRATAVNTVSVQYAHVLILHNTLKPTKQSNAQHQVAYVKQLLHEENQKSVNVM